MHPPWRWINTIRNGLVSASKRTGKAKRIDPNVRLLFVSIFSNSFSLFFPPTRTWPISGTERTERPSSLRNTAADIIARSCRGNNKKIRDEVDGKNEKTVSRISTRERYLVDIDRPSNVGTSSFNVSTSNCVSREVKTIFNDFQRFVSTRCRVNVKAVRLREAEWLGLIINGSVNIWRRRGNTFPVRTFFSKVRELDE